MIRLLTLTLIFLTSILSHSIAQEFAPIGAKWTYSYFSTIWSEPDYTEITCIGDTIIQDKSCKILALNTSIYPRINKEYIYQSNDTIFNLANNNKFYILYIFDAKLGDSWTTRFFNWHNTSDAGHETEVTVNGVDSIEINGTFYKKISLSEDGCMSMGEYIDYIGGLNYMFPQDYGTWDVDINKGLRCYADPNFSPYNFGLVEDCQVITTTTENINEDLRITVYPNPTYGDITLENNLHNIDYLIVYDVTGNKVYDRGAVDSNETINIPIEQAGLYYLEAQFENQGSQMIKIVKH